MHLFILSVREYWLCMQAGYSHLRQPALLIATSLVDLTPPQEFAVP